MVDSKSEYVVWWLEIINVAPCGSQEDLSHMTVGALFHTEKKMITWLNVMNVCGDKDVSLDKKYHSYTSQFLQLLLL